MDFSRIREESVMGETKKWFSITMYAVLLGVFFTGVSAWYYWLNPLIKNAFSNQVWFEVIWVLARIVIWVVPVMLFLKLVDREKVFEYLKLGSNLQAGIVLGILLSVLWIVISIILEICFGDHQFNLSIGHYLWIGGILVGVFEEIPFRGFLLPKLENYLNFWIANFITTIVYTLHYFPKWISQNMDWNTISVNLVPVVLGGLVFGYVYQKTKSLWSVIILHAVVSLLLFVGVGL